MTRLLTYPEIDPQQWQALVEQSSYATWFQTKEAYAFYASLPEEMMPFAYGIEREGELRAVLIGYITCEKNVLKQYFTRRAIIIGGPLLAEDISDEALTALLLVVTNTSRLSPSGVPGKVRDFVGCSFASRLQNPIYIETRNFNDYSRWKSVFEANGFAYQPHYDIHVHCNAQHQMSDRRQRELKRAIKNGATVAMAQSEQEIRDWYQILAKLYREKVRTPLFSEEFFLQFYRNGVGKYFLVKHAGKVIGGMMCPVLEGKALYEWYVCGLDEEYRELYPSVMATNAAIEYAKANHLPLFDFMGAGKPDEPYGVRDFKMEFGGELKEYGRFLCVRKSLLYAIGKFGVRYLKNKTNK